jgi:O-antigen/teichoic acid export membrane protein
MEKSYTKKYLKIYFWQGIALVLNFLSMLVVIPYLTSQPGTYGVYSLCISFTIFLSYADLGFIGAGQKYASEYFAKGDIQNELKTIGFSNFILLIFLSLFTISFFVFSSNPSILLKGINGTLEYEIASSLFLILAAFSPTIIVQRITQMIYSVRLEDYIIQRTNIFGNVLKIASVFWFFKEESYNIVGYFLFSQIISFFTAVLTLYFAKIRYNYSFKDLFKSIRFDRIVWKKTKGLAFAGLFMTISWILYYELDSVAIASLLGAKQVGIYALGLIILTFFRSILAIIFSPFNVRFNHFIGKDDEDSLKIFFLQIVKIASPIVVFPILITALFAKPIVSSWVGNNYEDSIYVIQLLVFCNVFAFLTYPTSFMLVAKEQQHKLYLISSILPIIFWTGIIFCYDKLGVLSFAIFKLIAFILSAIILFNFMAEYLNLTRAKLFEVIVRPLLIPVFFIITLSSILSDCVPIETSKINFLFISSVCFLILMLSFVLMYLTSKEWKNQVDRLFHSFFIKI